VPCFKAAPAADGDAAQVKLEEACSSRSASALFFLTGICLVERLEIRERQ
jgi:hypothetical protein